MKNSYFYLVVFFMSMNISFVYSQDTVFINTAIGLIKTSDKDVENYKIFLDSLDKSDFNSINVALKYFEKNLINKGKLEKDICALMFELFYHSFSDIYIDENGKEVSYKTSIDNIKRINDNLQKFGLKVCKIPDGNSLFIIHIPEFLYNNFLNKVSKNLEEYFYLERLEKELWELSYNTRDFDLYINTIEELLIRIEKYNEQIFEPLNKKFINQFYAAYLFEYLNLNSNWEIGIDDVILGGEEQTLVEIYERFINENPNTVTSKILIEYNSFIKTNEGLPELNDLFFGYNKNIGIKEIRDDLDLNTIFLDFKKYMNSY